ncbi:MAG: glycosyltransferase family 4 protein [Acidimicrobiales bacterium]
MKVLVVHNRYRSSSPSGEDRVVDDEHAALAGAGHDVVRFERASDDIASWPAHRKVLLPLRVIWNGAAVVDLDDALAGVRPDVVHVHNVFPLLSPAILRSCDRMRVPCVVTLHNYQLLCPSGLLHRTGAACNDCVERRVPVPAVRHGCYRGSPVASVPVAASVAVHRRAWQRIPSAYLFLSEAQRRALEPLGLPAWRSFVKPNLVRAPAGARVPEDLVVYLGRLAEVKGLRVLMRAWDRVAASPVGGHVRLAIAGAGPMDAEVRTWAAAHPTVELHGLLDREGCDRLLQRAVAVVVPSEWQEPFGLVVAEAMAAGVPPVATAHGAFPELVTDEVDGLLSPPGDAAALAAQLGRLVEDSDLARRLGAAARQTYARRFTPAVVVKEIEAAYRFAVANPRWADHGAPPGQPAGAAHQPAGAAYQAAGAVISQP